MKFLPAKIAICVLILCIIVAGWGVIIPYGIIVGVLYISYLLIKALRACLKSSNEDGNEGKRENLSRNIKFAFTIFPKSAEFVEPAEKTLYHPAAWQNDKLV